MPSERRDIAALIGASDGASCSARARSRWRPERQAPRACECWRVWRAGPERRSCGSGWPGSSWRGILRALRRRTTRAAAARAIEHACQACRNLVITAEECEREPARWPAAVRGRVLETATRTTADAASPRGRSAARHAGRAGCVRRAHRRGGAGGRTAAAAAVAGERRRAGIGRGGSRRPRHRGAARLQRPGRFESHRSSARRRARGQPCALRRFRTAGGFGSAAAKRAPK